VTANSQVAMHHMLGCRYRRMCAPRSPCVACPRYAPMVWRLEPKIVPSSRRAPAKRHYSLGGLLIPSCRRVNEVRSFIINSVHLREQDRDSSSSQPVGATLCAVRLGFWLGVHQELMPMEAHTGSGPLSPFCPGPPSLRCLQVRLFAGWERGQGQGHRTDTSRELAK
jgi:hypothetical protein